MSADKERLPQQHDSESRASANEIHLTPVATIRSCYPERFGVPRQPGLVKSAQATIVMPDTEFNRLSIRGLDAFTHLWIVFVFHQQRYQRAKPLVNPPRLGGKTSIGVFATRSPNRPNPIGLSAVELINIETRADELLIHIKSGDFLDGTPVIDIKPYVPFVDSLPHAHSDWAPQAEPTLPVTWNENAARARDKFAASHTALPALIPVIEETIALDPRPAYERRRDGAVDQSWGMRISRYNIRWQVTDGTAIIISIDE